MQNEIENNIEIDNFSHMKDFKSHYFYQIPDETFDNYIYAKKHNFLESPYDYKTFKLILEDILIQSKPLEILNILSNANGNGIYKTFEEVQKKYPVVKNLDRTVQKMERIYYEFYHEDENFRPDLIKTDIEELKKMEF